MQLCPRRSLTLRYFVLGLIPLVAPAQQAAGNDGVTLQSLLTEVRQLRLALERTATVGPRLQIAIARYQIQQERVDRMDRELRTFRAQLASASSGKERLAVSLRQFDDQAAQAQDAAVRRQLEEAAKAMKSELEQQTLRDQQDRMQEMELSNQFKLEQAKLHDLSDQLDQLDRKLQQQ